MVSTFLRPRDSAEALRMLRDNPGALPLAGGTYLLTGEFRQREFAVVSVSGILPAGIGAEGAALRIGANATFQDLADSGLVPEALRDAARSMGDRNIRNRATVGGNLGAGKSCASLVPVLLALDAELELADGRKVPARTWLEDADSAGRGLVAAVRISLEAGRRAAYARVARTACDLSILTASASLRLESGKVSGLRIAMGGLGPRCRRFPELESLLEGRPLPGRDAVVELALPLFNPVSDIRGSAEYKRRRAGELLAEVLRASASGSASGAAQGDTRKEARS